MTEVVEEISKAAIQLEIPLRWTELEGDHMLLAHPEGDELARRRITPNHHAVARGGQPRVLHADVVLVGEEGGEPLISGGEAEHGAGRN